LQDYQSLYLNIYADLRGTAQADKEPINDDLVFELELVKQVEVNVDYILLLVEKYLKAKDANTKAEIRAGISRSVDSSPSLRDKKDLIEQFVDSVSTGKALDKAWATFVAAKKDEELSRIIAEEGLDPEKTKAFIEDAFRDGAVPVTGVAIMKILPPASRFSMDDAHATKKRTVLSRLLTFFSRYFGLGCG